MAYADILRSIVAPSMEDVADLIEGIFSAAFGLTWGTWTPTWGGTGSLTFTSVTTNPALYIQCGKLVILIIHGSGTTGGTTSTAITYTLPVTANDAQHCGGGGFVRDGGSPIGAVHTLNSTTQGYLSRYDAANWGLGASRVATGVLIYRAA